MESFKTFGNACLNKTYRKFYPNYIIGDPLDRDVANLFQSIF